MAVEKILLEFDADIKALRSDMNRVKSQLGEVEKQGNKTTSQLSSGFKRVGAAIGAAFSVQVLIQFTKKAVELYDIQAKAEASLLQALKGREDVQRRLMRQASELQKITLFGDEETIKAQAMLAKFGMTETQIRRLIPLIQDYAAAQGQDLVSAADMVARSVGSSTNALSRYGIEINGAVGSNERLESAVESLSEMFGGQAVAAAEAGAGAVQQFQNAWGDFAESVGDWIMPALTKVVNGLDNIISAFAVAGKSAAEMRIAVHEAFDDKQYTMEQDLFIEYLKKDKDRFNDLEGAAESYLKVVNDIIADYNEQIKSGVQLTKVQQDTYKSYVIQTEAVRDYVNANKDAKITIDDAGKSIKSTTEKTEKYVFWLSQWLKEQRRIDMETAALKELFDGFQFTIDNTTQGIKGMSEAWKENYEQNQKNKDLMLDTISTYEKWQELGMSVTDVFGALAFATEQLGEQNSRMLEFSKQAAITQVLLSQGVSIANALKIASTSSVDPLTFFTTLATITATILSTIGRVTQLVNSAEVPAFATGVVDLKGSGTETSDSINARLSRGESVITAKGTRQDKGLFEAANKLKLEEYINKNYVLPALVKVQKDKADMFDDYRLYRALKDGQRQDREMNNQLIKALSLRVNKYNNWA